MLSLSLYLIDEFSIFCTASKQLKVILIKIVVNVDLIDKMQKIARLSSGYLLHFILSLAKRFYLVTKSFKCNSLGVQLYHVIFSLRNLSDVKSVRPS